MGKEQVQGETPVTKGVEYCPWSISGMLKERRRVEEEKKWGGGRKEKKGNSDKSYQQMLQWPLWTHALSQLHSIYQDARRVGEGQGEHEKGAKIGCEKEFMVPEGRWNPRVLPWAIRPHSASWIWYPVGTRLHGLANWKVPRTYQPWFFENTCISGWWKLFTNTVPHSLQKAQLGKPITI